MMTYVAPLLFAIFVWWASTGLILYLDGRPRCTFKWTLLGATVLAVLGFVGLRASSAVTTTASAYCAFTLRAADLGLAGSGVPARRRHRTAARALPAPTRPAGGARVLAFQTVAHHELALVVLGAGVVAVTWRQPNRTGLWTFAILWAMRQSAKLNVFLGVRNLSEEFLPDHLRYLQTYFRRARMNWLFPVVVALVDLARGAGSGKRRWRPAVDAFTATSLTFAASLLSLAILEHWFLVLPLPSAAMWNWGLRSREPPVAERLGTTTVLGLCGDGALESRACSTSS